MLLSAVSVLVVAQSSSEIPEGLTNNSVVHDVPNDHSAFILDCVTLKMNALHSFDTP